MHTCLCDGRASHKCACWMQRSLLALKLIPSRCIKAHRQLRMYLCCVWHDWHCQEQMLLPVENILIRATVRYIAAESRILHSETLPVCQPCWLRERTSIHFYSLAGTLARTHDRMSHTWITKTEGQTSRIKPVSFLAMRQRNDDERAWTHLTGSCPWLEASSRCLHTYARALRNCLRKPRSPHADKSVCTSACHQHVGATKHLQVSLAGSFNVNTGTAAC